MLVNGEEVQGHLTKWLEAKTLGISSTCYSTSHNVYKGENDLGFRIMKAHARLSLYHAVLSRVPHVLVACPIARSGWACCESDPRAVDTGTERPTARYLPEEAGCNDGAQRVYRARNAHWQQWDHRSALDAMIFCRVPSWCAKPIRTQRTFETELLFSFMRTAKWPGLRFLHKELSYSTKCFRTTSQL